jgi:hypothetical protein
MDHTFNPMKSLLIPVFHVWLLLSGAALYSQSTGDRGLLLGFNASSFCGTDAVVKEAAYIPGISLGFFQEFRCGEHLVFGPELAFITKGSLLASVGDLQLHQVITYVEAPLLVTWCFMPEKKAGFYVYAGPAIDFKLVAFNEVGFPEEINPFDLGLVLGGGIRWTKIRLSLRMNQGLLDLDLDNKETTVKNRSLIFTTGITF